VTSLCEIKFNRKDVKHMNTLMCRRLVAALYQVKAELNKADDKEGRTRQIFGQFVPDQFIVLYGVKSLAIKNINEFLYGVRKQRSRTNAKGVEEDEPLLYFFWQASHHGVPEPDRVHADDFDFYIDLLSAVADTVSHEHTLKMKGGAFWNMLGSMAEIELPVFVLLNTLAKFCLRHSPALEQRLKKIVLDRAKAYAKEAKGPKPPQPAPSYKPTLIGEASMDSRGHLPLESFLKSCLGGFKQQRLENAKGLSLVFATWDQGRDGGFDDFSDMLTHAKPEIQEREVLELYAEATAYSDEIEISRIEEHLRRRKIVLKMKPGKGGVGDGKLNITAKGAGMNVLEFAHTANMLFGTSTQAIEPAALAAANAPDAKPGAGGAAAAAGGGEAAGGTGSEAAALGKIAGAFGKGGAAASGAGASTAKSRWKTAAAAVSSFGLIRMLMADAEREEAASAASGEASGEAAA
jgi:hypothetical protein